MKSNLNYKNKKKSICIVCATPLTLHFFFKEYIKNLSKDFNLTIIYNDKIDTFVDLSDLGAEFLYFPLERKVSFYKDIISLAKLMIHFSRNHYDLVWGIAPKAGLLAGIASFLAGVRIRLFIFQGEVWANSTGIRRYFFKIIDRIIAKLSTNLLAVSHGEKEFLIEEGVVIESKIEVLGSGSIIGVDTFRFFRDEEARKQVRSELGYYAGSKVCIYLGRLNRDKGLVDLAKAFRLSKINGFSELKLLFVGPDEEGIREDILAAASPYTEDIIFLPFTKNPVPVLSASDLFCLPSYREGFPISVLEASSCELPVIVSSIYGNRDAILDGKTGHFFPKGNVRRLSELLTKLHEDEHELRTIGTNGRKRVIEQFRSEFVINNYLSYIYSLMENE